MALITRKRVGTAALAAGWALAAAMSGVGLIRLVRSDDQPLLIGVQGIGMWLLLPAYPLAVAAAVTRKRALAAVAVALALGNVVWVSDMYRTGTPEVAPAGAATMHLVTANMLLDNPDVAGFAADLVRTDADVIALQEVTPQHLVDLRAAGLLDAYPHQVLDPHPKFHGSAILSRLPIAAGGPIDVAGSPMTQADIVTAAGPVRVVNVHTVAPVNEENTPIWQAQMGALAGLAGRTSTPVVMAGDFNATGDHEPMDELLAAHGLRDAFAEVGRGVGATWPQWDGPMIPLMRLDHVVVTDTVAVLSVQVQDSPGSDHRRLSVELAFPPAAASL
jgi:endonuclease/exonuclease/phosphatase (EEP) superfamily protein YafD